MPLEVRKVAKEMSGESRGFGLGVNTLDDEMKLFKVKLKSKGNILKNGLGVRMSTFGKLQESYEKDQKDGERNENSSVC